MADDRSRNRRLLQAARANDLDAVRTVLADSDALTGSAGVSALLTACRKGLYPIVGALVLAGVDINRRVRGGPTALEEACRGYQSEAVPAIVALLLEQGANPKSKRKDDDGPLQLAAMYGHGEAVRSLLAYGAPVNARGAYGRTALIYAASSARSPPMVQQLIDAGAHLGARNEGGDNALFEVITDDEPSTEVAAMLLDHGLNLHARHRAYGTALCWAAFCGRAGIVELLLQRGARVDDGAGGEAPVIRAMCEGHTAVVKLLLKGGADPRAKTLLGTGLFEFAAEQGDRALARSLLDRLGRDSDPDAQPGAGLARAAANGDAAMVGLFLAAGVDVDARASWGSETALMKASYYGHLAVAKELVDRGADIAVRDSRGNTPLLHAAWSGHTEVVRWLLDSGADIAAVNKLNWTALMQACVEGHAETARLLLERGVPTDAVGLEKGATALSLAKHVRARDLVALLEEHGARERSVRAPAAGEGYFSIFDCDVCAYLKHKKEDLGRTESPADTPGLELVFREVSHPDRYTDVVEMVKRCTSCGTYYHHDHAIDTEDAFVGGPSISQDFQRYSLTRLVSVLRACGQTDALAALEQRIPALVAECTRRLEDTATAIPKNFLPYVIETVMDVHVTARRWDELERLLLRHPAPAVAQAAARDMILMFGERPRKGVFPPRTSYRDFNDALQEAVRALLANNRRAFAACLEQFADSDDEHVAYQRTRNLGSADYYKVLGAKKKKRRKKR